jgi:probable phosphoglycerate mutase
VALTEQGREQARALGAALARDEIDLCVTSEFARVRETAELALAGRGVPVVVLPELNEAGFGRYEGLRLDEYRAWATTAAPGDVVPGDGGESRAALAARYARAYRELLSRPERTILVVGHGLALRYLLNAAAGVAPAPAVDQVPYAEPFRLTRPQVEEAVARLEAWCAAPAW